MVKKNLNRKEVIKRILKNQCIKAKYGDQSSHIRELEKKAGMVELIAEAEYTKQRQLIENQAEIMKIQHKIA